MRDSKYFRSSIVAFINTLRRVISPILLRAGVATAVTATWLACVVMGDDAVKGTLDVASFVHVADLVGVVIWPDLPFSGDASRIVTVRWPEHIAEVWDATSCKPLTQPLHHDCVGWAQLTYDGKTLFTVSDDEVRFWDVLTSTLRCSTHVGREVLFAELSPDGMRFVTKDGQDATILHLWRAGERKPFAELPHSHPVTFAAFDNKSLRIVTREWTAGTPFHLWDAKTGAEVGDPIPSDLESEAFHEKVAAFDACGKRLVIARQTGFCVADAETGKIISIGHTTGDVETMSLVLSADGTTVAVLTRLVIDKKPASVQIFNSTTGKRICSVANNVVACGMSPDGRLLLCGPVEPRPAELWDLSTGSRVQVFPVMTGNQFLSPNGTTIAFTDKGKTCIWRLRKK